MDMAVGTALRTASTAVPNTFPRDAKGRACCRGGRASPLQSGQFVGTQLQKTRHALQGGRLGDRSGTASRRVRREARASSDVVLPSQTGDSAVPPHEKLGRFSAAFWKFLRPHTIRGTVLGSLAVTGTVLLQNREAVDWGLLPRALLGVLALLCGNGYIVGINQVYDVDVDRINKPFLPIAAGELSIPAAWALCGSLAACGLAVTMTHFGPLISALYSLGLFLGTVYSVPPLQLKRFAVPAFMIIATVRGFLLNFGVYCATRTALGLSFAWSPSIMFITGFVTVFATVIAITKDLADVEGDRRFGISTFATQMGVQRIAFLGSGLLLANYVAAVVLTIYFPQAFQRKIMIGGHTILAMFLVYNTWLLDKAEYTKAAVAAFYRSLWNLFYIEYAMLPFL